MSGRTQESNDKDFEERASVSPSFTIDLENGTHGGRSRSRTGGSTPGESIDITMSIQLLEYRSQGPNPLDIYFSRPCEASRTMEESIAVSKALQNLDQQASKNHNNLSLHIPPSSSTAHFNVHTTYTPRNSYHSGIQSLPVISENAPITSNETAIRLSTLPIGHFTTITGGIGNNSPVRSTWSDKKLVIWALFGVAFFASIVIPLGLFAHELKPHSHKYGER